MRFVGDGEVLEHIVDKQDGNDNDTNLTSESALYLFSHISAVIYVHVRVCTQV